MKFPHIYQSPQSASCGPFSLWMVNEYYKGIPYTPRQLVSLCRTTARWGTDDPDLIEAAQKLGYDVQEIQDFTEYFSGTALICYNDGIEYHWAVCTEIWPYSNYAIVTLQDPYYGPNIQKNLLPSEVLIMYTLTPMK